MSFYAAWSLNASRRVLRARAGRCDVSSRSAALTSALWTSSNTASAGEEREQVAHTVSV